jgi:hypothetical protein
VAAERRHAEADEPRGLGEPRGQPLEADEPERLRHDRRHVAEEARDHPAEPAREAAEHELERRQPALERPLLVRQVDGPHAGRGRARRRRRVGGERGRERGDLVGREEVAHGAYWTMNSVK